MTFRRALWLSFEWRCVAAGLTFLAAFAVTRRATTSAGIVGIEAGLKLLAKAGWLWWRA